MAKCPVCSNMMVEKDFGGVNVDVCENGCKGLFFDLGELERLDQKNEGLGESFQAALRYPRFNDANRPPLTCPKCSGSMHAHKYHSTKEINIDECYGCGVFFIDSGELAPIEDNHLSEQEREVYADKLANSNADFVAAKANLKKSQARAEAIARFTRFLRVSYYVTGK